MGSSWLLYSQKAYKFILCLSWWSCQRETPADVIALCVLVVEEVRDAHFPEVDGDLSAVQRVVRG